MATRAETAERKARLRRDLIESRGAGDLRAGEPATSQRELAQQYGLSQSTVAGEIRKLTGEGVLHCVPRVGTFAGAPAPRTSEFYLLITLDGNTSDAQLRFSQSGFEEAIARRGDAALMLEQSAAIALFERGAMPPLAGIFDLAFWPGEPSLERFGGPNTAGVSVAKRFETRPGYDLVSFDDIEGGRIATRHLLSRGHQKIAFLALHALDCASSLVDWSAERESGWRMALQDAGLPNDDLAFHPNRDTLSLAIRSVDDAGAQATQREFAQTARDLTARTDVTAVVAANDYAALELLEALRASGKPRPAWPAIVGFDNDPLAHDQLLTSLHLPFDELGRAAGELLWERHNGHLSEAPQQRIASMRVIPRLTCQPSWAQHTIHDATLTSGEVQNTLPTGDLATT